MKNCYKTGSSCCQSFIRNIMANGSVVVFMSVFVLFVQLAELVDGMPTENVAIKSTSHRQKRYLYEIPEFAEMLCHSDARQVNLYYRLKAEFSSCVLDEDIFAWNLMAELCKERGPLLNLFVAKVYDTNGDGKLSTEEKFS